MRGRGQAFTAAVDAPRANSTAERGRRVAFVDRRGGRGMPVEAVAVGSVGGNDGSFWIIVKLEKKEKKEGVHEMVYKILELSCHKV